jgi:hypothetical protein
VLLAFPLLLAGPLSTQEVPVSPRLATGISFVFVKPITKPNFDSVITVLRDSQAKAKAACDVQGGTLDGLQCVLPPPPPPAPIAAVIQLLSGSDAKSFIYMNESGNNPAQWNSSGCLGLGQACPASKLLAVCPVVTDYACQDAWFTNYMLSRYGTWEAAKAFWQRTDPRPYPGHWW